MKKYRLCAICALMLFVLASCGVPSEPTYTNPPPTTDGNENVQEKEITFAVRGEKSPFRIVYDANASLEEKLDILSICDAVKTELGAEIAVCDDQSAEDESKYEIIINSSKRGESAELAKSLDDFEYSIKTYVTDEKTSIIIVYKGRYARMGAIEHFKTYYVKGSEGKIPAGLDIKEKARPNIVESDVLCLRDPCVLYDDGVYYMYGTGWSCYKNSTGSLDSGWEGPYDVVEMPQGHESEGGCHWAPEVHKYNGAFYMFTTYLSNITNHRGCVILKSSSPLGPFVPISDSYVTPRDWDSIDGTLYVDDDGQPWMVFVHEWTSTDDGVGRMAAAKLSDDLTHFISEPIELFRADDAWWSYGIVTDGCWMYKTESGSLLMLWSNWDSEGYCVGIAVSESGSIEGPWRQEQTPLYSKAFSGKYDGGHGMIFTHTDGNKYLVIHSPNNADAGRPEKPVFIPLAEQNGTLVWVRR